MGRRKKSKPEEPLEEPGPNLQSLDANGLLSSEAPDLERAEEIIDPQEEPKPGFDMSSILDRARDNLTGIGAAESAGRGGRKPYIRTKQRDEISTLVSSLVTLFIAAWSVPAELKPSDDEINALSSYSTRLLLRHVSLAGRLTADVLDVIGILAVASGWYARTSSAWRDYRGLQGSVAVDLGNGYAGVINERLDKQRPERVDPIQDIDPNAAEFLNRPRGKNAKE